MALAKCKECGELVSNKAKNCPKCGAKAPKKRSAWPWVLVSIVAMGYIASKIPTDKEKAGAVATEKKATDAKETIKNPIPEKLAWYSSSRTDEMTGKVSAFTHSPATTPTKRMAFPYSNVESWMGVGCDGSKEWVYFGFSTAPNLSNDETKDGYSLIKTRIKWNDKVEKIVLTQNWNAKFINVKNDNAAIAKISASNNALLELNWHGSQGVFFDYSLKGSSKALAEMREICANQ